MCLARACCARGYSLFKVRPKLHMQEHFSLLGYMAVSCSDRVLQAVIHADQNLRVTLAECARQRIFAVNPMSGALSQKLNHLRGLTQLMPMQLRYSVLE